MTLKIKSIPKRGRKGSVIYSETRHGKVWLNEWDVVNKDESRPEKRFQLYTLLQEHPRLVCVPDGAFLMWFKGASKVFYLEQDRATSGAQQIANSKTAGYAAMAEKLLHRRHFPETTLDEFSVLMVAPSPKRRDSLRHAIRGKPGAGLWRFAARQDLAPAHCSMSPSTLRVTATSRSHC